MVAKQAGEVRLAVAKVVLKVVAAIFEHVVVFVLDLPARARGGEQSGDIFGGDLPVRDKTAARKGSADGFSQIHALFRADAIH